ncbi:MAG: hypothetical protein DWQ07_13815 [Chloroflexi bacterium]|nr:MAG: hypothetical protein DWQ07_13815 [Chloroflexota bacterium]MBL1194913.1 hypothetical protein [Chloroflexota bacterium]
MLVTSLIVSACQPTPPVTSAVTATSNISPTATVADTPQPPPTATITPDPNIYNYTTQSGDSLQALALRFGVEADDIKLSDDAMLPESMHSGFIDPGLELYIPKTVEFSGSPTFILPDREVIFSASASDFDVTAYVNAADGFLATFNDPILSGMPQPASEEITIVALHNSVNPRLMLALLELQCDCVTGPLADGVKADYMMGVDDYRRRGLYRQLMWSIERLFTGYYGWRDGSMTEVVFPDGTTQRLDPRLNAGSVALFYTLAQLYTQDEWENAVAEFDSLYSEMFGSARLRPAAMETLFEPGFAQPELSLPFLPGRTWAFTGGPHSAWEKAGANAALDFTPASLEASCETSYEWIVASASGLIVRAERGVVVQDLDGDGNEQTGWVLVYVHVADAENAVEVGEWLEAGELLGHPSCEGGPSSSTHLHLARKYNGEWMLAGGPIPFVLDGWVAAEGETTYQGTLSKDGDTIAACQCGTAHTYVTRPSDEDQ